MLESGSLPIAVTYEKKLGRIFTERFNFNLKGEFRSVHFGLMSSGLIL
jgi:hypothetical protein